MKTHSINTLRLYYFYLDYILPLYGLYVHICSVRTASWHRFNGRLLCSSGVAGMPATSTLLFPPSHNPHSSEVVLYAWRMLLQMHVSYLDTFFTLWTSLLPQLDFLQPGYSPQLPLNILILYHFSGPQNVFGSVPWTFKNSPRLFGV